MTNLLRPGDWLVTAGGAALIVWLYGALWHGVAADRVVVRAAGQVVAEASLARNQTLRVPGPLGTSVIEIADRRARVAADPGPRQYCVQQGWLSRAGEAAICLPNQVSIELAGSRKAYDSINY